MSDSRSFVSRSALVGAVPVSGSGAGVTAVVRDGLALATVLARKGVSQRLTEGVRKRFEVELPTVSQRTAASDVAFAGTGPGAWLAIAENGGNEFAARLMGDLDGLASVSDQSDGYVLIRLSGARVRDALAKLIPIDLHPRAFEVGAVASTVASHIGVTLWRLADEPDAAAVFEIVMFRSLARSFWHALAEAAAEYGFVGRAS
jgi:heterotetrameric sarcosine oxidase gamma subunit